MTDDQDFPGVPSLDTLAQVTFGMSQMTMQAARHSAACIKIMQALVQDLSARDPEIVDRIKKVFTITPVSPDIAPSVDLILSAITSPDDPNALHEDDMTAPKH